MNNFPPCFARARSGLTVGLIATLGVAVGLQQLRLHKSQQHVAELVATRGEYRRGCDGLLYLARQEAARFSGDAANGSDDLTEPVTRFRALVEAARGCGVEPNAVYMAQDLSFSCNGADRVACALRVLNFVAASLPAFYPPLDEDDRSAQ